MRAFLALSLAAVAVGGFAPSASATCMEHPGPAGIRFVSCAAPGGPVHSYVCYRDTCYPMPNLGGDEGPPDH